MLRESGGRLFDALVICNGEPPSRGLARRLAIHAPLIVAADGGANIAWRFGIRPDLIVGDLDSITPAVKKFYSSTRGKRLKPLQGSLGSSVSHPEGRGYTELLHIPRQDNTDLEKALDVLLERKVKRVIILAATGKRIDHTLGNLSVLWNYTNAMDITLAGDEWIAFPVGKMKRMKAKRGTTVSLIPFGVCRGITLTGLQYPLTTARMRVGEIGLSNVVVKSPCTVSVHNGNMLMIVQADLFSISIEP